MTAEGGQDAQGGRDGRRGRDGHAEAYWWSGLRAPNGAGLPDSVAERLAWYERHKRRSRIGFYASEVVIVLLSASVPAAAAMGASAAVTGGLGAGVAASVGLRQLFRWSENWIRTSGSTMALQQMVVAWSAGAEPYAGPDAHRLLVTRVEELAVADTATWSAMRSTAPQGPVDTATAAATPTAGTVPPQPRP